MHAAKKSQKILVVIPTYNEKGNIADMIRTIVKSDPAAEILIVDDQSPDGTSTRVKDMQRSHPVIHLLERNERGFSGALKAGFSWGLEQDRFSAILTMDADFSHDPKDIPCFKKCMESADVCVGSRYIPGGDVENWSRRRVLLSRAANIYTRLFLNTQVHDLTAGYVCYGTHVLKTIPFESIPSEGYAFQIEMKHAIEKLGFVIRELPITFTERREGKSKLSRSMIWEALWVPIRLRFWKTNNGKK